MKFLNNIYQRIFIDIIYNKIYLEMGSYVTDKQGNVLYLTPVPRKQEKTPQKFVIEKAIKKGIKLNELHLVGILNHQIDCMGANLKGAKLKEAVFYNVCFASANFEGVDLEGSVFCNVYLMDANFKGSNLTNVNFEGANLYGVDVEGATMSSNDLDKIKDELTEKQIKSINIKGN